MIGSNIRGKCDVTLWRAIQPLTFDVLHVLFFLVYFPVFVFDYTDCLCFERKKDEEDFLSESGDENFTAEKGICLRTPVDTPFLIFSN